MSLPEYHFNSTQLADYIDKVKAAWELFRSAGVGAQRGPFRIEEKQDSARNNS